MVLRLLGLQQNKECMWKENQYISFLEKIFCEKGYPWKKKQKTKNSVLIDVFDLLKQLWLKLLFAT